jgi:hypothetical protein
MTVQIGKLERLMVDQQQHAFLRRQQRFETDISIAGITHVCSLSGNSFGEVRAPRMQSEQKPRPVNPRQPGELRQL